MTIEHKITTAAANGKLTFAELRTFVMEADHAGTADTAVVSAHVTWGSAIKSITVSGSGDPQ